MRLVQTSRMKLTMTFRTLVSISKFMLISFLPFTQRSLAASPLGAYNPQLNNTFPRGSGPVIPYNGSGDVPALYTLSPKPEPLPNLRYVPPLFFEHTIDLDSASQIEDAIFAEIVAAGSPGIVPESTNCSQCISMIEVFHLAALTQSPAAITSLLIRACNHFGWSVNAASCESEYSKTGGTGAYLAQVLRWMSLATQDMQAYCHYQLGLCDVPPVMELDEREWFSPKPSNVTAAPPSGKTMQVLHFSDWHLDPRYERASLENRS